MPIPTFGVAVASLIIAEGAALGPVEPIVASGVLYYPWLGQAEWTMTIDADGGVKGAARGATCRLTDEERKRLDRLLSALPMAREEYRFAGGGPADVHPEVVLSIRRAGKLRTYSCVVRSEPRHVDAVEVESVLGVWRFLRGLCRSPDLPETVAP